jgi:hypothetical protein
MVCNRFGTPPVGMLQPEPDHELERYAAGAVFFLLRDGLLWVCILALVGLGSVRGAGLAGD